ncbi:MAG: YabP/YqfC family sporulation protein [Clostridia bacterium]|nr:YabP/YqfC family sporulation protein [Clostridia bacterium]
MKNHEVVLKEQKSLHLTGVCGVDGMTEKQVDVQLENGKLVIKGDGLSVSKLDVEQGNLFVTGDVITSLVYTNKGKTKNGLAKLFK